MNFAKISFGSFQIQIIGIFVAIAFMVASVSLHRAIRNENLDSDFFVQHFWRWVISGLILGRIFGVLLGDFGGNTIGILEILMFWMGGINVLGAGLGFFGFAWYDLQKNNKNAWRFFDQILIPILAGLLILDVGSFMTGAWYGRPTDLFWGIKYNSFGVEFVSPVHPVGAYGFALHYALLKFLQSQKNTWKKYFGLHFLLGLIGLCSVEFCLQFFRGDSTIMIGPIRLEAIIYLLIALLTFTYYQFLFLKKTKKDA